MPAGEAVFQQIIYRSRPVDKELQNITDAYPDVRYGDDKKGLQPLFHQPEYQSDCQAQYYTIRKSPEVRDKRHRPVEERRLYVVYPCVNRRICGEVNP